MASIKGKGDKKREKIGQSRNGQGIATSIQSQVFIVQSKIQKLGVCSYLHLQS